MTVEEIRIYVMRIVGLYRVLCLVSRYMMEKRCRGRRKERIWVLFSEVERIVVG